jgi:hypothetical protein
MRLDSLDIFLQKLFLSDHCACETPFAVEDVIRKVAVELFCIDGKPEDPSAYPKRSC